MLSEIGVKIMMYINWIINRMQGLLVDDSLAYYGSINLIFTVTIIPHQNPDRLNKKQK